MLSTLRIAGVCLSWIGFASVTVATEKFEEAFAFAFIDAPMEAQLKGPPFDRSLYARAIDRCRELGAKGVVIKLFLDREFTAAGDEALAQAMGRLPVVMQARLEPQTGTPDELAGRFVFATAELPAGASGDRGWIPVPRFMAAAVDIGFVDFADEHIPLLEVYRGKTYKSVVVCALELQSGEKARLDSRQRLMLGDREFGADGRHVLTVKRSTRPLPACSLADLLAGKVDRAAITGRVVILGYTGSQAPMLSTPDGEVTAHVLFGQCLRAVFEGLESARK